MAYEPETESCPFDQALGDHSIDNGWIRLLGGDVSGEAQAHNASWADRGDGKTKLLLRDLLAIDGYCVLEVVALDATVIEILNVEAIAIDKLVCATIIGVDCHDVSWISCRMRIVW